MNRRSKPPERSTAGSSSLADLQQHRWFVPIGFVAALLALVVLFSDFLFSGKMLYGSDTIQAGIFFRSLLVDHVHEFGTVPQWNPYIFGGMPYIEAFHGDIFYPLSFLKFFGSIYRQLGMVLFWHIFLAGVCMYFAARQLRLEKLPALITGICYMFAHYLVSLVAPGHDGKIFVTTLFPLVILFADRGFEAGTWLRALFEFSLLGLVIGVIILSPHPQMSYFMLWALGLFTAYKLVMRIIDKAPLPGLFRPTALTAYAVVLGLMISAVQFYPGYYYTTHFSPRADSKKGWDWATSWSLHEEEAFSQLIPEFVGTSSRKVETYYWGKNPFKDNAETVGIIPIFLAVLGIGLSKRRDRYFFSGLALFALLYGLGATTPVFRLFYWLIPKVESLRAPSMIMFLWSFSVCLLAGFGVQALLDAVRRRDALTKRQAYLIWSLPILLGLLALGFSASGEGLLRFWSSIFYSSADETMVRQGLSKLGVGLLNLPQITKGAWLGFLFVSLGALFVWLYRTGKAGVPVLLALAVIPVVDGVRFNSRFIDTLEPEQVFGEDPVSRTFAAYRGQFRVLNVSRVYSQDKLPLHETEVITGYHGNQLRWYDELLGGPGLNNQLNPRLLNLAGAEYILHDANATIPEGYLGPAPVRQAASFGQVTISRNPNAFPRVYLVDSVQVIDQRQQMVSEILGGNIELRQVVLLEEPLAQTYSSDPAATGTDSAWVILHAMDSVIVGVNTTRPHILVLTDNFYDAWQARVDGASAEIRRCYGTFRAVELPAGAQRVEFHFDSPRYNSGRAITMAAMGWLVLVVGLFLIVGRKKKSLSPSDSGAEV